MRIAWLNGNMTIVPESDDDRLLLSNVYIEIQSVKFGWPTDENQNHGEAQSQVEL